MKRDNVLMDHSLPHNSLVVEHLWDTLGSKVPGKITLVPHLNFPWVVFEINPHLLNTNL